MFCGKCGEKIELKRESKAENPEGIERGACQNCEVQTKEPTNKKIKWPIVVGCLLIVLVGSLAFWMSKERDDGDIVFNLSQSGFESPEAAMIAYLEGVRDSDLDKMMSAFAIEALVEGFDFEVAIGITGAYTVFGGFRVPNENDFLASMNVQVRRGIVANLVINQYLEMANTRVEREMSVIMVEDAATFTAEFIEDLLASNMETLEIAGFIPSEVLVSNLVHEQYVSEDQRKWIEDRELFLGSEETIDMAVMFLIDGRTYILIINVTSYGGEWFLSGSAGVLGYKIGLDGREHGVLTPESIESFFGSYEGFLRNVEPYIISVD